MINSILVLGAGLVGKPMAIDLSLSNFQVGIADNNLVQLSRVPDDKIVTKYHLDLSDISILKTLIADYDIVLNALPGHLGFQTLRGFFYRIITNYRSLKIWLYKLK